jgi:heme exporter protein B
MTAFLALVRRDILLASRIGGGAELGLIFFLTVIATVPFAVGPDTPLLSRIAPAIIWIAALLATLLGLDRLFQADEDDGALDGLMLAGLPYGMLPLAKALAHWLVTGLPLAIGAPLLGLLLAVPIERILPLMATLLVGTPALTLLGSVGAAVTVGLRRGGLLLSVLVLPLAVPVIIFGVSAATASEIDPHGFRQPFLFLCALTSLLLVICPIAAQAALKTLRD